MVRLKDGAKQTKKFKGLCKRRVSNSSTKTAADREFALQNRERKNRVGRALYAGIAVARQRERPSLIS